jgi:hypothetical protein
MILNLVDLALRQDSQLNSWPAVSLLVLVLLAIDHVVSEMKDDLQHRRNTFS